MLNPACASTAVDLLAQLVNQLHHEQFPVPLAVASSSAAHFPRISRLQTCKNTPSSGGHWRASDLPAPARLSPEFFPFFFNRLEVSQVFSGVLHTHTLCHKVNKNNGISVSSDIDISIRSGLRDSEAFFEDRRPPRYPCTPRLSCFLLRLLVSILSAAPFHDVGTPRGRMTEELFLRHA